MFVITDPVDRGNPFYLRWDEFRRMRDSGRWDLQLHAAAMHKMVRIDAKGTQARPTPTGSGPTAGSSRGPPIGAA